MRIGVSPEATVVALPMTGTKFPASFSFLKKSRPGSALSSPPPLEKAGPDGGDGLVGRGRVAGQGDLVLVLGLEQVGPVLRDVRDDLGVDLERQDAVVVAVPDAVGVLGGLRDRVPGRDLVRLEEVLGDALRAEARPTSTTSGACGPGLALLALMASISSFEPPSGLSPLIGIPYLAVNPSMSCTVVAPVARQRDGVQAAFGLGRGDEGVHVGRPPEPLPTRRPRPAPRRRAAVDAPAVRGRRAADDEHAANTKLATTRRPATRVTVRWVDKNPSSSCVRDFRFEDCRGPPSPDERRPIHRQCGGRRHVLRGLRVHWTARSGGRQEDGPELLTAYHRTSSVRTPDTGHILPDHQAPGLPGHCSGGGASMTAGPGDPGDTRTLQDPLAEALRVVDLADAKGLLVRLMGGMAIRAHAPTGPRGPAASRSTSTSRRAARTAAPSTSCSQRGLHAGQAAQRAVRWQAGVLRRRAAQPAGRRPGRQARDVPPLRVRRPAWRSTPTLPLAELLLSKLQIVKINRKDVLDALVLLAEHPLAQDDGAPDARPARARSTCRASCRSPRTTGAGGGR